jgi:hypothetical protein
MIAAVSELLCAEGTLPGSLYVAALNGRRTTLSHPAQYRPDSRR